MACQLGGAITEEGQGQDNSSHTQTPSDIRELLNAVKSIQASMEVMSQNVVELNCKLHSHMALTRMRILYSI